MTAFLASGRVLLDRRFLLCMAWLLAVALGAARIANGRLAYRHHTRADGNFGHTTIDFGGQWLMGRMLATGHGRELYSRPRQWEVAEKSYSPASETPNAPQHDPEMLIQHFMGEDDPRWLDFAGATAGLIAPVNAFERAAIGLHGHDAWAEPRLQELMHPKKAPGIGGPLYPPIHAFMMLPFALGDHPQAAYIAMQWFQTLLCFLAGRGVSRLSPGRFWWPLASSIILIYPGCRGAVDLGQNSPLTLTILIWGWAFMARGRPALGGALWGLLAYKAVWAVSFFLLLVLIRRWRAALAMASVGVALISATLPFVGWECWLNWLSVGQEAAQIYNVDANWIHLSRDVLSMPRRFLLDFSAPREGRERLVAVAACWMLWALFIEIALRVHALWGNRRIPFIGPVPAFFILTAWMCTYHFMYYDALLSAFGVFVLLADPQPFFQPRTLCSAVNGSDRSRRSAWFVNSFVLTVVALILLHENTTQLLKFEATALAHAMTSARTQYGGATEPAPRLVLGTSDAYPIDTFLAILIWCWCVGNVFVSRADSKENEDREANPQT